MAELILLGSGTGIPSLMRGSPGLLLISENSKVLIDSGPGILRRMLKVGVTYRDIDLLLYTHIHPDHISDLIPILFACKYPYLPRQKELIALGGPGFKHYFDRLKNLYWQWVEPKTYHLAVKETSEQPILFQDLKIFSKPMAHISESVGYRIEFNDGRSIAISGDTDYCESVITLSSEVDLLVLECSFPEGNKVEGHLTPSLAARIALESRAKRLLLTHLYPMCDQFDLLKQCGRTYKGEIIVGEDLMRMGI